MVVEEEEETLVEDHPTTNDHPKIIINHDNHPEDTRMTRKNLPPNRMEE
jgi:hypothetical protein